MVIYSVIFIFAMYFAFNIVINASKKNYVCEHSVFKLNIVISRIFFWLCTFIIKTKSAFTFIMNKYCNTTFMIIYTASFLCSCEFLNFKLHFLIVLIIISVVICWDLMESKSVVAVIVRTAAPFGLLWPLFLHKG